MDANNFDKAKELIEKRQSLQRLLTNLTCGHNVRSISIDFYMGKQAMLDVALDEISKEQAEDIRQTCIRLLKTQIENLDQQIIEL